MSAAVLPSLIAHADWSKHARKRFMATATLQPDDRYRAYAPRLVGPLKSFRECAEAEADDGPLLLGFDFPIGLPAAYAARAEIDDFVEALPRFGSGRFASFYDVADSANQINLTRPFFPFFANRPSDRSRQQLLAGLGLAWCDLLRRCDRASETRPAACALFWTLGGQQVGKAAIVGWRDLLAPALRAGRDLRLWPFDGKLEELMARCRFVIAETYPAEFYRHLELRMAVGKGKQEVRQANAERLLAWAKGLGVELEGCLIKQINDGFGADARGDDRFDAAVGLFGMLNVVLGQRAPGEPDDPAVRRIEGWILGQEAAG
jgi:hypothetical protein